MYYKLDCKLRNLHIPKGKSISLNKNGIFISINGPSSKEMKPGKFPDSKYSIIGEFKINERAKKVFQMIKKNEPSKKVLDEDLRDTPKHRYEKRLVHYIKPSKPFLDYKKSIHRKLYDPALTVIRKLRWRYDLPGPPNPLTSGIMRWSEDKETWYRIPYESSGRISIFNPSYFSIFETDSIEDIPQKINREPLHHEIFRESWIMRFRSIRSSLIIGITSAEVGTKNLISTLAPKSEWILENVQSPPIVKIIKGYVPTLPTKNLINGKVLSPPEKIISSIENGIFARNRIIHRGSEPPSMESLKKILLDIKDWLWLIDYYSGNRWAIEHLQKETKIKLNIESE